MKLFIRSASDYCNNRFYSLSLTHTLTRIQTHTYSFSFALCASFLYTSYFLLFFLNSFHIVSFCFFCSSISTRCDDKRMQSYLSTRLTSSVGFSYYLGTTGSISKGKTSEWTTPTPQQQYIHTNKQTKNNSKETRQNKQTNQNQNTKKQKIF